MLDTILLNVYVIRLGLDVGTELNFLYVSFDRSNKFALILLGGTLGFTDVEVIRYD